MADEELQEFMAHFPAHMSRELVDYVTNTVFLASRYLFVWRDKDIQMAYCTHCRTEYPIGRGQACVKHNEQYQCFNCQSNVVVKADGRGRKHLQDDAYLVWYEKSVANPKAIVAFGIYVVRNYAGDYRYTETQFSTEAMYLFEPSESGRPGRSRMFRKEGWGSRFRWLKSKTTWSLIESTMKYKNIFVAEQSVGESVKGTPFQYSTWEGYQNQSWDWVKFLDLAARYPCVEYLTKLGLRSVVDAKLVGRDTYRIINWRGKTVEKVLRLTKAEIKEVLAAPFKVEPLSLYSYHYFKRNGASISFEDAHTLRDLCDGYHSAEVKKLLVHIPIARIARYVLKQLGRYDAHYRRAADVITAWRDYIGECQDLGMNIEQEHVLFPNNLHGAHQKTTEKVRIKADEALNMLIAERVRELTRYSFEQDGLMLRPALSTHELFEEGKALNHCVGRYSKTYAEGKTNLFLVRKVDEPEVPFFTVEVIKDEIVQARGKSNCLPSEEVAEFLEAFEAARLKKPKRRRVESEDEMGVAV